LKQNILRRAGLPILACMCAFLLFLVFYSFYHIFPCGANTIVWCDMAQQTVPLLEQFRTICHNGESLSYTIFDAGGMQFYGVFFFFLSNPFSLAALFTDIPADQLAGLLVIVKLSLSAGTAALWLQYRAPKLQGSTVLLLAMMYGCCGYGMFYYQNLMWLDIMAMLPLLMLSMHHLLEKQKAAPYFFVLSAMMLLCYYLCFMIVLFVLIYMAVSISYTVRKNQRGGTALRFWAASFLSAAGTAWIWIPNYIQVCHSARRGSIISGLYQAEILHRTYDKLALITCTALCITVLPLLFRKKRLLTQNGRRSLILCGLLSAALILDPVNQMWHTGSYQAFPLRWGMIPILLLLTAAALEISEIQPLKAQHGLQFRVINIALAVVPPSFIAAVCFAVQKFAGDKLKSYTHSLWLSPLNGQIVLALGLLFAFGYGLLLFSYQKGRVSHRCFSIGFALLFLCEFTMNFKAYFAEPVNSDSIFSQTKAAGQAFEDQNALARIRLTRKYTHANMLGATGKPTMAHYTSLTRADYLDAVKRFGYSSYWMEVPSTGGTVLSDLLWNVKYQLGQEFEFPSWTKTIWLDDKQQLSVAESQIVLPAALYVSEPPSELASLPHGSRIAVQEKLAKLYLGSDQLITRYTPALTANVRFEQPEDGSASCICTEKDSECEIIYQIYVKGHQALYFDLYSQTGTELYNPLDHAVTVCTERRIAAADYPQKQNNGILFLGEATDEPFYVRVKVQKDFQCESFGVFGIDMDEL